MSVWALVNAYILLSLKVSLRIHVFSLVEIFIESYVFYLICYFTIQLTFDKKFKLSVVEWKLTQGFPKVLGGIVSFWDPYFF